MRERAEWRGRPVGAPRIVVVGAGYAGLAAARGLVRRVPGARITVVNPREAFVERVRLHQVATGQPVPDRPLRSLLDRRVDLRVAEATRIDPEARQVVLGAAVVPYDVLVLAVGSHATPPPWAEDDRHPAHAIATHEDAVRLREALRALPAGRGVTVVGGGLTGIETAAEIAASRPDLDVGLCTIGVLGDRFSARGRRCLHAGLGHLGVRVEEHRSGTASTGELTIWAGGFAVPTLAARSGLAVDARGRVRVDASLRSISHPDVYAVGDAAAARDLAGAETLMSCQTALPMGQAVARVIAGRLRGDQPGGPRIRYVWTNVSLGRRLGVTQFRHADGAPRSQVLDGRPSALFKEVITRGSVAVLRARSVENAHGSHDDGGSRGRTGDAATREHRR